MSTELLAYHSKTTNLALFRSAYENTVYWIGSYNPHLRHCNPNEPYAYSLIRGHFATEAEGLAELALLKGDEF